MSVRISSAGGGQGIIGANANTYFTFDGNCVYLYVNGAIQQSWCNGISTGILLENGTDYLMLEDGTSYILQES